MDGVLGRVDTDCVQPPKPQVYSHGNWPVKKLQVGQTIRFRSQNYGNMALMKIERIRWFDKMAIISGTSLNDVAFGLSELVELVTVEEAQEDAG